jgi:hypothetical protein
MSTASPNGPPLVHTDDESYTLPEGRDSVWITVRNLAVNITRCDEGVSVDIYAAANTDDFESLGSTWVLWEEGEPEAPA